MTAKEGKALLQECFQQCQCEGNFDETFCYKYGNQRSADGYQHSIIEAQVDFSKAENNRVKFVVKCFIHLGLYVAWPKEIGYGSGKFFAYRKDLIDMSENPDVIYKEVLTEDGGNSYYFRGRKGIIKFMEHNMDCRHLKAQVLCS